MLVDTDVLIWYLKGNNNARQEIAALSGFFISVVTYIELVQGMRNKQELIALRRAVKILECNSAVHFRRCFSQSPVLCRTPLFKSFNAAC